MPGTRAQSLTCYLQLVYEIDRPGSPIHMFWPTMMLAEIREAELVESNRQAEQARKALQEKTNELEIASRKPGQLSILDPLTGFYNRRRFDKALRVEWYRSGHAQKPLALMMIDVDHFKLLNDRYGHLAGDECLKKVRAILLTFTRRGGDVVAGYGGEEFCIISANADIFDARLLAEDIRSGVEALAIRHEDSCFGVVTISIGLTVSMSNHETESIDFLLSVGRALYAAKEAGRNCVIEA